MRQTEALKKHKIQLQYQQLIDYLNVKLDQKDWHGVRDTCVDIEVLVAVYPWLESAEEKRFA